MADPVTNPDDNLARLRQQLREAQTSEAAALARNVELQIQALATRDIIIQLLRLMSELATRARLTMSKEEAVTYANRVDAIKQDYITRVMGERAPQP